MANENCNHVIISCPCYVWDDDFIREGTGPLSLFMQFLAHWVPMKAENKIWWELRLCFQWEWWPVPAKSKALAELLSDHTNVQQLWVWTKQHSSRERSNLIYVHHLISTLALKWWWVAMLVMCPVCQECQPLSQARDPACFCGCCWTRQIRSSHSVTSPNTRGV